MLRRVAQESASASGGITREGPQKCAQPLPMRFNRVEAAHQQIEQPVPHRPLAGVTSQRRLIQHHAEPPQQRELAGKPHSRLAQGQAGGSGGLGDREPRPTGIGREPEGGGDQGMVEIVVTHAAIVCGAGVGFNPPDTSPACINRVLR